MLCLVGVILGILLESVTPLGINTLFFIFTSSCIIAMLSIFSKRTNLHILAACTLSIAAGNMIFALHAKKLKNEQSLLTGHYAYLVGIITNKQQLQHTLYQEYFTIKLEGGKQDTMRTGKRLQQAIGIYTKHLTAGHIGDKILLKNVTIKKPSQKFTLSDLSLAKQGIVALVFTATKNQCRILEQAYDNVRTMIWKWREKIYKRFKQRLSINGNAYVSLLFFGNKQNTLTSTLQDKFALWGLSHYLARSGLHIVLLIAMWFILLRLLPINIRFKSILLSLFVITYAFCSWESTSFLRAFFVFLLAQCGFLMNKQVMTLHLLTIVCMGMIIYNPFLIFYLDFQLTFGLTFGLLIFSKYLKW